MYPFEVVAAISITVTVVSEIGRVLDTTETKRVTCLNELEKESVGGVLLFTIRPLVIRTVITRVDPIANMSES